MDSIKQSKGVTGGRMKTPFVRLPSPPSRQSSISLPAVIGTVSGCLALVVSITSAYFSYQFHRDSSGAQLIRETYATFYDLNKKQAENADISHMFVCDEDYQTTAALVRTSLGTIQPAQKARYVLREKAVALYIFTVFEQTLYQYNLAVSVGDKNRAEFLQAVLDYFTGRLMRNPRLLYYWAPRGGNLAQYFEESTIAYYNRGVFRTKKRLRYPSDAAGPYDVAVQDRE